jgi:hypothetical protein
MKHWLVVTLNTTRISGGGDGMPEITEQLKRAGSRGGRVQEPGDE